MNDQEALERYVKERQHREMWTNYLTLEQKLIKPEILLTFEITHRCFLRCRHCFAEASPENNDFLDLESVVKVAEEIPQLMDPLSSRFQKLGVRITGGDPYLHPLVFDIIKAIAKQKDQVRFLIDVETSGGFASDDDITKDYVSRTKEAGADCISMTNDKYHSEQEVFPNSVHGERIKRTCEEIGFKFRYVIVGLPVAETLDVKDGVIDFYPSVTPIGRARNLPPNYWLDQSCVPECALNPFHNYYNPMIDPNGNVYLCNSGKQFHQVSLAVGNIRDKGFLELLFSDNPVTRKLRADGVIGLSESAGLLLAEHYELLDNMGPCGLCHEVLRTKGKEVSENLGVSTNI